MFTNSVHKQYMYRAVFSCQHTEKKMIYFSAFLPGFTFWLLVKKELIRSMFIFAFCSLYSPVTGYLYNQINRDHGHPNLDGPLTNSQPNQ